ncbi:YceD family protein [Lyngbya confervoides]|uniref:YceD family protein n=1 Tax=Lyngbya confervoides BDU141951 TaxID=1574623 RepID=A0ABD4T882_9CYAN|nr:YceD family protein [Lyngbya confervoides]MCM1984791.1 YceD family protein [Lyngbya confervoides BDU141951]
MDYSIYLPRLLQAPDQTESVTVETFFPDLETLTPVKGWVKVTHGGTFLEVVTQASTIVTLTCDRCLQQYNHRLKVETSELIWLESTAAKAVPGVEVEVPLEDLVETLDPAGFFKPDLWLYEQLCLELPFQKLCDGNCEGLSSPTPSTGSNSPVDQRWAALNALKHEL